MIADRYLQLKGELEHVLAGLIELASEMQRSVEQLNTLRALLRDITEPLLFVVVGEVKSGKSSLLNALFGNEFAKVDVLPATDRVYIFRYGSEEKTSEVSTKLTERFLPISFLRDFNVVDTPGTNTIRAYALDAAGNSGLTNSVKLFYVLCAPIELQITGKGTVNPNYIGQCLEIGRTYTMTVAATPGFAFTSWTGSQITNKPTLTFLMASNLDFTANFLDIQKPASTITIPIANQRWSNELFTVAGKAGDNDQVAQVLYLLNTND